MDGVGSVAMKGEGAAGVAGAIGAIAIEACGWIGADPILSS